VEALLQIYSRFLVQTIRGFHIVQNYTRLTAISIKQCHYLAVLPAKMSVFNRHICDYAAGGSHSMISNKPWMHTKKSIFVQ